jgi:DNA-binding transcriptional MerR regulator
MVETEKKGKLFYKIGEVSRMTGLEPYVLRFWETEFSSLHPRKNVGRQRLYTQKDIDTVLRIKKMLYEEGLTIAGARKRISSGGDKKVLIDRVRKELRVVLTLLQSSKKR